ncbi:hypothetical protein ACHAXT_010395 [Thalassiosira profunda]
MSYNYDQCVQSIQEHRRRAYAAAAAAGAPSAPHGAPDLEALQQSIDGFASLSNHCPMTPLLWMQYAHDTEALIEGLMVLEFPGGTGIGNQLQKMRARKEALETSTGILELALAEFPGCALLHLYYLESLADLLFTCEGLRQSFGESGADQLAIIDRLSGAFEAGYQAVGRGTHVNEGAIVSEVYRLHGSFLLFRVSAMVEQGGVKDDAATEAIAQQLIALLRRWSKTPMGEGSNDEMMQDLEFYWDEASSLILSSCADEEKAKLKGRCSLFHLKSNLWEEIDANRRKTSSLANVLSSHDDAVDVAMATEGISLPRNSIFSQQTDANAQPLQRNDSKWSQIVVGDAHRFLLGLGGSETSRAFSKATSSLQRTYHGLAKKGKNAELSVLEECLATYQYSLVSSLYERAVSECPTVEALWVSYLNFLRGEYIKPQKQQPPEQQKELASALLSTSQRAVRNCPYSCTLFEMRMTTLGLTSASNLEPDNISAIVQEATELGFLTPSREAMLHLRLVAILVVKRKLLSLVSLGTTLPAPGKDYDQGENMAVSQKATNGKVSCQPLNPTVSEEVQDLLEDIRDMYDEADTFLFKSHSDWSEGKVSLWKHRALTEAYVLCPIGHAIKKTADNDAMDEDTDATAVKEAMRCFEKLVKAQKPSHPDSWREYIVYVGTSQPDSIAAVASRLRKTRGLYQRALSSVKKAGQEVVAENRQSWMGRGADGMLFHRGHDTAVSDLCREYMEFERTNGSEESFSQAQTVVRNKLANWTAPAIAAALTAPVANGESNGKRKHEEESNEPAAMAEDDEEPGAHAKRAKVKTDLKQPKKTDGVHKVKIGKMEYPAHPFTIHVSNLSKETQDMDLVDALRPEFGAIVHAKILRQKHFGKGGHHFHGESKGAGLVQFEERLSVEKALQKDGELDVGGNLIKIQRSHLPAVGLVPPGMHRVNPKGGGKTSKRNKLKRENKMKVDTQMDVDEGGKQTAGSKETKNPATQPPPSTMLSVLSLKPRGMRQKPKINLEKK